MVQGVDEADIVKTDGKYIYILKNEYKKDGITLDSVIKIVNITGEKPVQCKSITLEGFCADDMYLSGKRLVIIGRESALINYRKALNDDIAFSENCSSAVFYDVSDPQEPKKSAECAQSGSLSETRLIDGKLYIISNYYVGFAVIHVGCVYISFRRFVGSVGIFRHFSPVVCAYFRGYIVPHRGYKFFHNLIYRIIVNGGVNARSLNYRKRFNVSFYYNNA